MRSFWSQIPMMRVALAVIGGIGLEIFADTVLKIPNQVFWFSMAMFLVCATVIVWDWRTRNITLSYRMRNVTGLAVILFLVSFGYVHTWLYTQKNFPNHFQKYLQQESFLVAQIVKPPLEKTKVIVVVAEVQEIKTKQYCRKAEGNILINLLRDSTNDKLEYGDVILFHSTIEEFDEPQNPEEFSFKLYQSFHSIYHRTFLQSGDWKIIGKGNSNFLMARVYDLREYFLSVIAKYVTDKNDFAVASAIMLGYNDYMNGDVIRAYASSGALHVLSVSGLHVGIMFLIFNFFLLQWMDGFGKRWQIAKAVIIIVFIWFYACLTGLTPSVLRSAMMFSMIQLGKVFVKNVNTYNVIFASAFILLLFNPFIVTEVGFRLSYLAVLGIIYLHPKIYALWIVGLPEQPKFRKQKNYFLKPFTFLRWDLKWFLLKFVDLGWQIVAVSLAAQIATCPLSLLYFHQFPVLFLISNLLIIPASNLILFFGTALVIIANVPYIADAVGWSFSHLLQWVNQFVFYVDSLAFALIQGISINIYEMIALYFLLTALCLFWYEKQSAKYLIGSLVIILLLCSFNSFEQYEKNKQQKIVVYSVPKQSAIAFIEGRKASICFDKELLRNESSMLFHVKHHWWSCGIEQEVQAAGKLLPFGKLLFFSSKKILLIDTVIEKIDFEMKNKLRVDLVVLSHNTKVYLTDLQKAVDFKEVVFDSSNKQWRINYWKKDCDKMKLKYWDVNEQGAYIQDLSHSKFSTASL